MYLSGFWLLYPLVIVWIIGLLLAIRSWQRHPQVSAAVLVSIGCMLVATVGQQVVYSFLRPATITGTDDVVIYWQMTAVIASLLRTAGWLAIFVAIFGWRDLSPGSRNSLQFSIKGLLIATLVVAVLCGLLRGLAALMGEAAAILYSLVDDIPVVLCWIAGGWLAVAQRHQHPAVSRRVLIAIALQCTGLAVNIAVLAFLLITSNYAPGLNLISSLVGLVTVLISWVLLLAAAFGGRTIYAVASGAFRESPS